MKDRLRRLRSESSDHAVHSELDADIFRIGREENEDPRPGRYLITGSVDLFRSSISPDSLAGRVETVELLPFSQAEIANRGVPGFLDRAFAGNFPTLAVTGPTVDLVLERSPRGIVGIEIKAGATVRPRDFKGLARLKEAMDTRFACGIVLHDCERFQQMASRLFAMPIKMLWEA